MRKIGGKNIKKSTNYSWLIVMTHSIWELKGQKPCVENYGVHGEISGKSLKSSEIIVQCTVPGQWDEVENYHETSRKSANSLTHNAVSNS